MRQGQLIKPARREKTMPGQSRDYDRRNLESAHAVLADPLRFGGVDSGMFQWAQAVIERLEGAKTSAR